MTPAEHLAAYRHAGVREKNIPVAIKAAVAGARGRHAQPRSFSERLDHYAAQTGRDHLTSRQRTRLVKKFRRHGNGAPEPGGLKAGKVYRDEATHLPADGSGEEQEARA